MKLILKGKLEIAEQNLQLPAILINGQSLGHILLDKIMIELISADDSLGNEYEAIIIIEIAK